MKIAIILLLVFGFLAVRGYGQATGNYTDIDVATFKTKMNDPNVGILDVRTPTETAQGKIPGAIELNVMDSSFVERVRQLDKSKTWLVYCRSGRRSARACGIMSKEGFEHLYNLKGGYNAWKAQQ
ncbi:MAG: rhodanese-like domain-containing protein [Bacteroidetes bacterium]|nr:MAG: rhodanese-like domain-containing protein [Bacteroidota bacterium]